jgi:deazaflavin-dependent oxidoreductase (nitroreductase family)
MGGEPTAEGEHFMSDWNESTIKEFRANEGRVGGMFEGAPLLLLHTTGRRSGTERVNPLMYLPDGDRWIVFASKGGHTADPHWLHNIEANPEAAIEVGTATIPVKAKVLREGPDRDALFARQVAAYPQFGEYEKKTEGHRTIPVIVLERAA